MATVTELVTKFSFIGSEAPLAKYNSSLGKSIGLLAGFTAGAFVAGAALAKWASGVLAAEQPLININAETGVAIQKIQELSYIAEVSNSSTQALTSSLSGLSAKIGQAAQKGSEDFARLGISVRDSNGQVKTADVILKEVGQRFRTLNLSMQEQRTFAQSLGIDASLVTMLNRTESEMAGLAARARELGTLNAEQAKQAQQYNDALTTLRFGFDGLRRLVAVGLGPELKRMAEMFTQLLIDNRDWIINGIKFSIGVLGDFLAFLNRMWPVLAAGVGIFIALKVATIGWGAALAVVFSPVVLITAGIVALLLVIDDLIVGLQGGESYIRDFFLAFFDYDIAGLIGRWTATITEFFSTFDLIPDWVRNMFAGDVQIDASVRPGGQAAANSTSNVNQQVVMEINTSDPVRAGEVAANELQKQMRDAQTQSKRGGM
jgi:hypothetical protein